jgi:hypothetical protein
MTSFTHVYPLRKTALAWRIPIMTIHTCDESCLYKFSKIDIEDECYIVQKENGKYKNGKCNKYGKKISAFIQLKFFDIKKLIVDNEPLYNPHEIVISDTVIDIIVRFPLKNPVQISLFAPSKNGFTRAKLIDGLKKIYEFIYKEEERTATPIIYEYREDCINCKNKDIVDFLKNKKLNQDELCSICYFKENLNGVSLPCEHNFHKDCILSWLKENNTCPLCRKHVISCQSCNGLCFISHTEQNVVIPVEYRGNFRNRNTTDGIFGIWGYDFEDLYLKQLFYDKKRKILDIYIGS